MDFNSSKYNTEDNDADMFYDQFINDPQTRGWFEAMIGPVLNDETQEQDQVTESVSDKDLNTLISKARKDVDTDPTEGQKRAGNYKKGHVTILGYSITIENPKGSFRKGVDADGNEWKSKMHNDYGYFNRTVGYDGDAIDVFIGPKPSSEKIFVVDQKGTDGSFDESKVMLGFSDTKSAKDAYMSNYEKGWTGFMAITDASHDVFKKWLYDGRKQRKPFSKYASVSNGSMNESRRRRIVMSESQFEDYCRHLLNKEQYNTLKY